MKIILCTTFRDFKGTKNDAIQYMFLESIEKQTYTDYSIVVTTFGEKNVEKVVKQKLGDKCIFYKANIPPEFRFSLTDVLYNGILESKKCVEDCILVWCTCDVRIDGHFFQKIVNNFKPNFSGIVHPNILFNSIDALYTNQGRYGEIKMGIDLLFFDARILQYAEQDILDYRFYDWGTFEYFLVAIALKYQTSMINLFSEANIKKVVNDRVLTNESKQYFQRCRLLNEPVLDKYVKDNNICGSMWDLVLEKAHFLYKSKHFNFILFLLRMKFILFESRSSSKIQKWLHLNGYIKNHIIDKQIPWFNWKWIR